MAREGGLDAYIRASSDAIISTIERSWRTPRVIEAVDGASSKEVH